VRGVVFSAPLHLSLDPDPEDLVTGSTFDPQPELRDAALALFGERLPLATEYARRLATDGVVRGLIGPRETERLWDRHLLNCAAVADLIPSGLSVVDVGSGAGLPGIVLAVARPDLAVVLVEPLARRTAFLSEVVSELGLDHVSVVRARAEDAVGTLSPADIVTARAVAPLDRLAGWCLPLARVGGRLLALKGATAADEIAEHRAAVARLGGGEPAVRTCGAGLLDAPTTVVEVVRERAIPIGSKRARPGSSARSRSGSRQPRR
jgi:16S rRNA (guanine527-N7)-methyltransferase